jgi:site-specific DNA recombinase
VTAAARLARRFAPQALLLEELARVGRPVVFLGRPISQDPHAQLLLQVRGAVAEDERALIADRARRGRLAQLRAGQLPPRVHTPYGSRCAPPYPRDPPRLRSEEAEASVSRQLSSRYADESLSLHAIAARVLALGIPTYPGGPPWHPATGGGMLRRAVYAGPAWGNRDHEVEPQRGRGGRSAPERQRHHTRHRPQEEGIAVDVPPILSRALCERVQTLRPLRQAQSRRNHTPHEDLLRARVSGAGCGLAAVGRPEGRHADYIGNGPQWRVQPGRAHCCSVRAIRADRLDPLVWEEGSRLLSSPQIITEALRKAHAGARLHDDTTDRVRHLQRARLKAERPIER